MQKLIKPAIAFYYIILFLVIWTYIAYSDTSVDLRMHIGTTSSVERDVPNLFTVWTYEKEQAYDFSSWKLETAFHDAQGQTILTKVTPVEKHGRTLVQVDKNELPRLPIQADFKLFDSKKKLKKQLTIDLKSGQQEPLIAKKHRPHLAEPGPYITDETCILYANVNDIPVMEPLVIAPDAQQDEQPTPPEIAKAPEQERSEFQAIHSHHEEMPDQPPRAENLATRVTYGQAQIASHIPVSKLGLSRVSIKLSAPADVEFRYGQDNVYGIFVTNAPPVRLEIANPLITPASQLAVRVKTMAGNNDVTFNYYDRGCWIGRSSSQTDSMTAIYLNPPNIITNEPRIIMMTACLSAQFCGDSAHQVAVIASPNDMGVRDQAIFALTELSKAKFEAERDQTMIAALLKQVQDTTNLSNDELSLARDYALTMLASGTPKVEPIIVARSESIDQAALEEMKKKHHRVANPLFIGMIIIGALVFILAAARARVKPEFSINESGTVNIQEKQIDKVKRRLLYLTLILIGAGSIGALYFLLQLL